MGMRYSELVEAPAFTPAFKAWFKKSKVVDASGQPLRVYHGTNKDFDEFRYGIQPGADQIGSGFYFTTNPDEARAYAGGNIHGEGGRTLPVYLSIQKPIDADKNGSITPAQIAKIIQFSPRLEEAMQDWGDVGYEGARAILARMASEYAIQNGPIVRRLFALANDVFRDEHADVFNKALHAVLGYDGVFKRHADATHWVAWFPEQVKIMTNKGSFDAKNPKFTEAKTPPQKP